MSDWPSTSNGLSGHNLAALRMHRPDSSDDESGFEQVTLDAEPDYEQVTPDTKADYEQATPDAKGYEQVTEFADDAKKSLYKTRTKRGRKYFSSEEQAMVDFLMVNNAIHVALRSPIWQAMEQARILTEPYRTWKSLQGHFRKVVVHKYQLYCKDPVALEKFAKVAAELSEMQETKRLEVQTGTGRPRGYVRRSFHSQMENSMVEDPRFVRNVRMPMEQIGEAPNDRESFANLTLRIANHLLYTSSVNAEERREWFRRPEEDYPPPAPPECIANVKQDPSSDDDDSSWTESLRPQSHQVDASAAAFVPPGEPSENRDSEVVCKTELHIPSSPAETAASAAHLKSSPKTPENTADDAETARSPPRGPSDPGGRQNGDTPRPRREHYLRVLKLSPPSSPESDRSYSSHDEPNPARGVQPKPKIYLRRQEELYPEEYCSAVLSDKDEVEVVENGLARAKGRGLRLRKSSSEHPLVEVPNDASEPMKPKRKLDEVPSSESELEEPTGRSRSDERDPLAEAEEYYVGKPFTEKEDTAMIEALIANNLIYSATALSAWEEIEALKIPILRGRTAPSMFNRFIRALRNRYGDYTKDPVALAQFEDMERKKREKNEKKRKKN